MRLPHVARDATELHDALGRDRGAPRPAVALVPTMGALHAGHLSLVEEARRQVGDGLVVVSVFVNPLQFGPGEDLERYPRTWEDDLRRCAESGVDAVFAPAVETVYPGGEPRVTVDPGPLGTVLEGSVRPTHFRGVLTVVAKLFGLVRPDLAVFGEKDYQQLVLVRRMVADLCLGVDVVAGPTVREADGLALSSRNQYLSEDERRTATSLSAALRAGEAAAAHGAEAALRAATDLLEEAGITPDYLALTDPDLAPDPVAGPARLLVAARVGQTRLIDNTALTIAPNER